MGCAAGLVAVSRETVGIKLRGSCSQGSFRGCFLTVAVFKGPARVVEGLLVAVAGLVLAIAVVLGRWRSGVAVHPESVAAVCALLQNPRVKKIMRRVRLGGGEGKSDRELAEQLRGATFALEWDSSAPSDEYGIVAVRGGNENDYVPRDVESTTALVQPAKLWLGSASAPYRSRRLPTWMLKGSRSCREHFSSSTWAFLY